jgi:hypothetical protein
MADAPPSNPEGFIQRLLADVWNWCQGRMWIVRAPLLAYLAYVGVRQFLSPLEYNSIFGGINLGIHEGGHLLFHFAGEFVCVAGGTIAQLSAPVIAMFGLLKQRDYFGIAFCVGWLSTNLISVGVYMADARDQVLPLVTVGGGSGEIIHDWHYLFTKLGVLAHDKTIGLLTRGLGSGVMLFALIAGGWMLWEMFRSESKRVIKTRE